MRIYDFVVIGAGSAGCVLANRLSADELNRVLVLEAGSKDNNVLIHMPAGAGTLIKGEGPAARFNWLYNTEGQTNLHNRRLYWPRGKVLGGSSSINGMIYIRGHARDYDHWRQLGLEGWGFADVLPYFKRAEDWEGGSDLYHGAGGPLRVSAARSKNPLYRAFVAAGLEAGHPHTEDFNGRQQEGFGLYQLTIRNGRRQSAAVAYLAPALERPNLTVETKAMTTRILFEGRRAVGVEYVQEGQTHQVRVEREVILAGGAVNSPQTLMLSGIGPAEHLRRFDIPVVADLPGVGQNLQDHLIVGLHYECSQPITLHAFLKPGLKQTLVGLRYLFLHEGPARENGLEAGAFLKSRPELEVPDLQIHFVAALMIEHGRKMGDRHGYTIDVGPLRPESRGSISLRSRNPFEHPVIQPNYLAAEADRLAMRAGVKLARDVAAQAALDPFRGPELRPGAHIQTDEKIDDWVQRVAETLYHPVGTARMGRDRDAVVDASLRVHGVEGLRVVDASVMPTIIGGNTNAPVIMIAEKAADMILKRPALAPQSAPIAEDETTLAAE